MILTSCVLSHRHTNLCIGRLVHFSNWPYLVPSLFFPVASIWISPLLSRKKKWISPFQTETANSKQAPSCLVGSWLANPPVWLGTDHGINSRVPRPTQPRGGGKGETLQPAPDRAWEPRHARRRRRWARGGRRLAAPPQRRCGFFWFLRAQRGSNYNPLSPSLLLRPPPFRSPSGRVWIRWGLDSGGLVRPDPVSLRIRRGDADKRVLPRRQLTSCSLMMRNRWLLDVVLFVRSCQLVRLTSAQSYELGECVRADLSLFLWSEFLSYWNLIFLRKQQYLLISLFLFGSWVFWWVYQLARTQEWNGSEDQCAYAFINHQNSRISIYSMVDLLAA